jgi:hypothetical protein
MTLMRHAFAISAFAVTVAVLVLVVLFPLDPVQASPPMASGYSSCPSAHPNQPQFGCVYGITAYEGMASLSYCFFGDGALYMNGAYYPLAQPMESKAQTTGGALCPAMGSP